MVSQIDINIEEVLNPKVLIVNDVSFYNPDVEVSNSFMEIRFPGSVKYVHIPVAKEFRYIINSNTLGITNVTHSELLAELPDGLYVINYSICPNAELFVEYKFLRNTQQLVKWHNAYCSLELEKCNRKQYAEELEKLREIKEYILAAKMLAECNRYTDAINLYNATEEMLNAFEGKCKCL